MCPAYRVAPADDFAGCRLYGKRRGLTFDKVGSTLSGSTINQLPAFNSPFPFQLYKDNPIELEITSRDRAKSFLPVPPALVSRPES